MAKLCAIAGQKAYPYDVLVVWCGNCGKIFTVLAEKHDVKCSACGEHDVREDLQERYLDPKSQCGS